MEKGINLLRAKEKVSEKEIKLRRFSQVGSSLLLIIYILILGSAFSFLVIQQREASVVGDKIKQTETKIKSLKSTESLQVALGERLKVLNSIFKNQGLDYKEALSVLEQLTPSGVVLSNFDLTKEGEIAVSGLADTSLSLGEFLVNLVASEKNLENITLSSVKRTEGGNYDFSLKLLFASI